MWKSIQKTTATDITLLSIKQYNKSEQKYHISDKKIPDIDCQYFEFLGFTEKSPENAVTPKNIQKQLDNIKGKDKSLSSNVSSPPV